jgi:hypothetical protein
VAEKLVGENRAERSGPKEIRLNGRRVSVLPSYDEVVADTAHWAGVTKTSPKLSEGKQDFLRGMKRLSG